MIPPLVFLAILWMLSARRQAPPSLVSVDYIPADEPLWS